MTPVTLLKDGHVLGNNSPKWRKRLRLFGKGLSVVTFAAGMWVWFGPLPDQVMTPKTENVQVFTDRLGKPLDGLRPAQRQSVKTAGLSRGPSLAARASRLSAATIAAEDQRFRSHPGIDPIAISRAFLADVRALDIVQGGSTLTQQLVKLRTTSGTSTSSKATQAIYAIRIDRRLSKDQLLSAYLAEAPYGGRVTGAEAAAMRYFGVTTSALTWSQAAYLAALPQRPTAFNPLRNKRAAIERRNWVLRRLRESGTISRAEFDAALSEPITLVESQASPLALHYIDFLESQSTLRLPVGQRNYVQAIDNVTAVRTTLDGSLQADIEGIAHRNREELRSKDAANVSIVVLDNATGAVRAWEGSGNYFAAETGGMINGPLVPRQTGSTVKPFIYALAFHKGMSPGDLVEDTPLRMSSGTGTFAPQNYDQKFHGIISARVALASSINVPAVKLLRELGPASLEKEFSAQSIELARPANEYGLSLALGTGEVPLLDMTRAYASFARGGRALAASFVEPALPQTGGNQVVDEVSAFLVTDVLADNEARSLSFGRNSVLKFPFPVAAKTGTSQDFHDNWVIGYTKEFTVGVWVGNFDRTPLKGATGVSGAGPIFQSAMIAAHDRLTPGSGNDVGRASGGEYVYGPAAALLGQIPKGLTRISFCKNVRCSSVRADWSRQGATVFAGTQRPTSVETVGVETIGVESDITLRLVEPSADATYIIDETRPRDIQQLPLSASGVKGKRIFTVDGVATGQFWPLVAGRHKACVTDSASPTKPVCQDFTVR